MRMPKPGGNMKYLAQASIARPLPTNAGGRDLFPRAGRVNLVDLTASKVQIVQLQQGCTYSGIVNLTDYGTQVQMLTMPFPQQQIAV